MSRQNWEDFPQILSSSYKKSNSFLAEGKRSSITSVSWRCSRHCRWCGRPRRVRWHRRRWRDRPCPPDHGELLVCSRELRFLRMILLRLLSCARQGCARQGCSRQGCARQGCARLLLLLLRLLLLLLLRFFFRVYYYYYFAPAPAPALAPAPGKAAPGKGQPQWAACHGAKCSAGLTQSLFRRLIRGRPDPRLIDSIVTLLLLMMIG